MQSLKEFPKEVGISIYLKKYIGFLSPSCQATKPQQKKRVRTFEAFTGTIAEPSASFNVNLVGWLGRGMRVRETGGDWT